MTPRPGRVSVIVPVHDRAAMLGELLRALAVQTWRDIEVVVVDDGSRDLDARRFAALVAGYGGGLRTVYRRTPHLGPAAARNAGIAAASGALLHFLDSDDLLFPDAIEQLAFPLGDEAYALGRIVDIDAALAGPFFETHQSDPGNLLRDVEWCTHAALYRREAIAAIGGYDEALRVGEDTLLQLRLRLAHGPGARIDSVVGVRRRHGGNHLSLGPIAAVERHRFLIASAVPIAGDAAFRGESRRVRLTSLAVFLLILAEGRGGRPAGLHGAFDRIADALLHDMPFLRRVATWIAVPDAGVRLAVAGAMIRLGRAARAAARGLYRMRVPADAAAIAAQVAALRATVVAAEPGRARATSTAGPVARGGTAAAVGGFAAGGDRR